MQNERPGQHGFTIVELLIAIVVVGILVALVLNSFATVQAKARDTQRKSDINAIATKLEACYTDACNGTYPTLANLTDLDPNGWVLSHLKNFDESTLYDSNNVMIQSEPARQGAQYQYTPLPNGCLGGDAGKPCTGFILTAFQETGNAYVKKSLNN